MVMVSRLRPLEVNMVFEDRSYKLGDVIDIDLELSARRDVVIREGRVDLTCQEDYEQTVTIPVTRSGSGPGPGSPAITVTGNKQATSNHNESYPHSSDVFLSETRLRSGATSSHNVKLEIGPDLPRHISDPTCSVRQVSWSLVATFDVAQTRDVAESQPIKVAFV
ncbi:MAG TPA: hypothetical protein DCP37_14185 [Dehalococcoidia bacterium]|nr:hypothetical protein [Dehalococcoidia bacterium]